MKLDSGQIHFLRLAHAEAIKSENGWATVSSVVWPLIKKVPTELIELKPEGNAGFCRLTDAGRTILLFS